jgi:hypothetical protein
MPNQNISIYDFKDDQLKLTLLIPGVALQIAGETRTNLPVFVSTQLVAHQSLPSFLLKLH